MHYFQSVKKMMKHTYLHIILLLLCLSPLKGEEPVVLDLTAQHPQVQTLVDTGVQAKPVTEHGAQMVLKPALYEVKIRGNVSFLIDCFYMDYSSTETKYRSDDSIIPRKERDDYSRLGYLTLQADDMTYEEAQAMSDAFHEAFGLEKTEADSWLLDLADDGIANASYRISAGDHYPRVSFRIDETYNRQKPAKLLFDFSWAITNEQALKRSKSTPILQNIAYDMPEILASLPQREVVKEEMPTPAPKVMEVTAPRSRNEEAVETAVAETVVEDVEQSSNWWLWLIGAVVIVIAILLFRSKSRN